MPVLLASKNLIPYVINELASGPLIFAKYLLRGAGAASITMVIDSAQTKEAHQKKETKMNIREINDIAARFDISDEEAARIAATVENEAEFTRIWENEDWWTDANNA